MEKNMYSKQKREKVKAIPQDFVYSMEDDEVGKTYEECVHFSLRDV